MPKKVLVSGCFDLLHSGHVEFFREAAEHGDLYVRVGSDENIKALKGHEPMYSNAERVFMAQSVKGVKDAAVSAGMGRFDFVEDAKLIKPDVYFVNDDASKLDPQLVRALNITLALTLMRDDASKLNPQLARTTLSTLTLTPTLTLTLTRCAPR